jgi:hypothetical protein
VHSLSSSIDHRHHHQVGRYSFTELQPGQYYVVFDTSSPEYKHSSKK